MSDILLLNPPFTSLGYKTMSEFASRSFPIGLGSLSGVLRDDGYSFSVLDADALNMNTEKMVSAVVQKRPRIIGISTYSCYSSMTRYAVKEIKNRCRESVIILGGHHAFALRGELLEDMEADMVAIGEGEALFSELCGAILNHGSIDDVAGVYFRRKGEVVYTGDRKHIKDLDGIPFPAYEQFPMEKYQGHFYRKWTSGCRKPFANIVTSRGCPFKCGFCSNSLWGKTVRFQSPERVIREIGLLVEEYGLRQLSFFDDTFTLDMKRTERICDLLIEKNYGLDIYCSTRVDFLNEGLVKKMARAGFKWIGIGIESGNDRVLGRISKGQYVRKCSAALKLIADNGIAVYGSVILGYPGEDKATLGDTLSFILNNPVHLPQFNIFVPYPATPVYNELVGNGVEIPKDTGQLTRVISYNKGISTGYLQFFQIYSYIRSFVNMRYFNLIRKTFKLRIVFSDMAKIAWGIARLDRRQNGAR